MKKKIKIWEISDTWIDFDVSKYLKLLAIFFSYLHVYEDYVVNGIVDKFAATIFRIYLNVGTMW